MFTLPPGLLVFQHAELLDGRNTEYWHLTPLSAFHVAFLNLVDLNTLVPLLCKNKVLYSCDLVALNKLYRESRAVQVGSLIVILELKGKEGLIVLIESLKEDEEHMGHWELAKRLEDHYGECVVGCCQ